MNFSSVWVAACCGILLGIFLTASILLYYFSSVSPNTKTYTPTLDKSEQIKSIPKPVVKTSSEYALTKTYPSFDNSYFALLQQTNDQECVVVVQDITGVHQDFDSDLNIGCSAGMGHFETDSFMGWIDERVFAIETVPGKVKILDLSDRVSEREKTISYDAAQWQLQQLSKEYRYMLLRNKNSCSAPVVVEYKTTKQMLTIPSPNNLCADSYYDYINEGFVVYWLEEKFENSTQMARMVFKYVDLADLDLRDALTTSFVEIAGSGGYPDRFIPQKGILLYESGSYRFEKELLDRNGRVVIKI